MREIIMQIWTTVCTMPSSTSRRKRLKNNNSSNNYRCRRR